MKKIILFLILIFSSFLSYSQRFIKPNSTHGVEYNALAADSALLMPTVCGYPSQVFTDYAKRDRNVKRGAFCYDSCYGRVYKFNPADSSWRSLEKEITVDSTLSFIDNGYDGNGVQQLQLGVNQFIIQSGIFETRYLVSSGGIDLTDSTVLHCLISSSRMVIQKTLSAFHKAGSLTQLQMVFSELTLFI